MWACASCGEPRKPILTLTSNEPLCSSSISVDGDGNGRQGRQCEVGAEDVRELGSIDPALHSELLAEARAIVRLSETASCETQFEEVGAPLQMLLIEEDGTRHRIDACIRPDGTPKPPMSLLDYRLARALGASGGYLVDTTCAVGRPAPSCDYSRGSCGDGLANGTDVCDGLRWRANVPHICDDYGLGAGLVTCSSRCSLDFGSCEQRDYCAANALRGDGRCDPCLLLAGFAGLPQEALQSSEAFLAGFDADSLDPDCGVVCGADGVCADSWHALAGAYACQSIGLTDPDCACNDGSLDGPTATHAASLDGVQEVCDGEFGLLGDCATHGLGSGAVTCSTECLPRYDGCTLDTGALTAGNQENDES